MTIIIKIARGILNVIYGFMKIRPPKNQILFLSRQSDNVPLDFLLLDKELNRVHPEYKTVIMCKKIGKGIKGKIAYSFHILYQMKQLARSKVVVLDSYCIAVSLLHHRKKLVVIQMWHSVGTMKKFGYSILDQPEGASSKLAHAMRMHHGYTCVLAAGEGYKDHLAEGFHIDRRKILTYPLPRVQLLQDQDYVKTIRSRILTDYPVLMKKKNLVYVPTFRKRPEEQAAFEQAVSDLIHAVDFSVYNLVIKVHPLADISIADPCVIADQKYTSMEMLFIADAVISDYSCIIYEAGILNKPLYFYTYDYDQYMQIRDIYMDYKKEVPGPVCSNAEELMHCIGQNACDKETVRRFTRKYVETNGHECERLAAFIADCMQE